MAIVDKPWVPIRTDLEHDPRVIAIARAVDKSLACVDRQYRRDIVCWRLRCVWSYWVTHSVAGRIVGFTAEDVDHVAGIEGFGKAMAQERDGENPWMVFDASGAHIPDFERWHWLTLRQRASDAARQGRYRDRQKAKQADSGGANVTGDVTPASRSALRHRHVSDRDENVTPIKTDTQTELKKEFPPSPHGVDSRKNGESGSSVGDGNQNGSISNGNAAPLDATGIPVGRRCGGYARAPTGQETRTDKNANDDVGSSNVSMSHRVEPAWEVQRLLREVGCDPDAAERLSRRPRLTPDVARRLAADCAAARPTNPTGWLITRLRESGIVPKGKSK